jgi:hypothetical protein
MRRIKRESRITYVNFPPAALTIFDMKATMKLAASLMALSCLVGCAPGGPVNQTAKEPTPMTSPTKEESALGPATVIAGDKDQILQEIKRWNEAICLNHPSSADCALSLQALNRMAKTLMLKLDATKPWPVDIADLAEKTATHLAAVAVLSPEYASASMIDTELVLLRDALEEWSALVG